MNKMKLKSAFGLVEVIISSTIIMIILGSIIFLSRNIISNAQFSAERFQALQIAQRDIEKIRQRRDSNYIDENPGSKWNSFSSIADGFAPPLTGTNNFYVLVTDGDINYIDPISSANNDNVEKWSKAAKTYNNQTYFRRVSFKSISGVANTLLGKPQIQFSGAVHDPFPAYVVTVEVLWFDRQGFKYDPVTGKPIYDKDVAPGEQAYDFDKLKKVTIAEIITDNRSGY